MAWPLPRGEEGPLLVKMQMNDCHRKYYYGHSYCYTHPRDAAASSSQKMILPLLVVYKDTVYAVIGLLMMVAWWGIHRRHIFAHDVSVVLFSIPVTSLRARHFEREQKLPQSPNSTFTYDIASISSGRSRIVAIDVCPWERQHHGTLQKTTTAHHLQRNNIDLLLQVRDADA